MKNLQYLNLRSWPLLAGKTQDFKIAYQRFGPEPGTAPVVLVNHALTGNSNVAGLDGWWQELIGEGRVIDTQHFTVVAINIPGNGYDGNAQNLIENYRDFTTRDMAELFWAVLDRLGINRLFAVLGGSLGGGIAWEMAALRPAAIAHLIPVATDWKTTDWIAANVLIQDRILNNSQHPIEDARLHAMLLYRTPGSLRLKFHRNKSGQAFDSENWLRHHGDKLRERFTLEAYRLMNHLLRTLAAAANEAALVNWAQEFTGNLHLVAVDSDLFFVPQETRETARLLGAHHNHVAYHEIKSVHGHDAFLIEYEQLQDILRPIFKHHKQLQHATTT